MIILKPRPTEYLQTGQRVVQRINAQRASANFEIPGEMKLKTVSWKGDPQTWAEWEANYYYTNGSPPSWHLSGATWDMASYGTSFAYLPKTIEQIVDQFWNNYQSIPSWEDYIGRWDELVYDMYNGVFWMMSRETIRLYVAFGVKTVFQSPYFRNWVAFNYYDNYYVDNY